LCAVVDDQIDVEAEGLAKASKYVLEFHIEDTKEQELKLRPIAGGSTRNAVWDAEHSETTNIIDLFNDTLDKIQPAELDSAKKKLKKVSQFRLCNRKVNDYMTYVFFLRRLVFGIPHI
jgi:hypothetical protein